MVIDINFEGSYPREVKLFCRLLVNILVVLWVARLLFIVLLWLHNAYAYIFLILSTLLDGLFDFGEVKRVLRLVVVGAPVMLTTIRAILDLYFHK